MKEDHTYQQDHRNQMEYDLDRQDKEWRKLNYRHHDTGWDWLKMFVWLWCVVLGGASFVYLLHWLEGLVR